MAVTRLGRKWGIGCRRWLVAGSLKTPIGVLTSLRRSGAATLLATAAFTGMLLMGAGCNTWGSGNYPTQIRPAASETSRLLSNAHYYKLMGRPDAALKEMEEAHLADPNNLKIADALAQNYQELGQFQRAQEIYQEVLTHQGSNRAVQNNLCFSYYLQGNLTKAESCFKEALERDPGNLAARNNLGLVWCRQGKLAEAQRLWEEAEGVAGGQARMNQALAFLGMKAPANYAKLPEPQPQPQAAAPLKPATPVAVAPPVKPAAPTNYTKLPEAKPQLPQAVAPPKPATPVAVAPTVKPALAAAPAPVKTPTPTASPAVTPKVEQKVADKPAEPKPTPQSQAAAPLKPAIPVAVTPPVKPALAAAPTPVKAPTNYAKLPEAKPQPPQAVAPPKPASPATAVSPAKPEFTAAPTPVKTPTPTASPAVTPKVEQKVADKPAEPKPTPQSQAAAPPKPAIPVAVAPPVKPALAAAPTPVKAPTNYAKLPEAKPQPPQAVAPPKPASPAMAASPAKPEFAAAPTPVKAQTSTAPPALAPKAEQKITAKTAPPPQAAAPIVLASTAKARPAKSPTTATVSSPAPSTKPSRPELKEADRPTPPSPPLTALERETTGIEVRNGTWTRNLAHQSRSLLSQEGFNVTEIGNHIDFGAESTVIYYRPGAERVVQGLKWQIFPKAKIEASSTLKDRVAIKILLGRDLLNQPLTMARLAAAASGVSPSAAQMTKSAPWPRLEAAKGPPAQVTLAVPAKSEPVKPQIQANLTAPATPKVEPRAPAATATSRGVLTAADLINTPIEIRNGTRARNLAHQTRSLLSLEGFTVGIIGNHIDFGAEYTVIYYRPEAEKVARALNSEIFPGARLTPSSKLNQGTAIKVVLGRDCRERPRLLSRLVAN